MNIGLYSLQNIGNDMLELVFELNTNLIKQNSHNLCVSNI
jgi:hypothetical protein